MSLASQIVDALTAGGITGVDVGIIRPGQTVPSGGYAVTHPTGYVARLVGLAVNQQAAATSIVQALDFGTGAKATRENVAARATAQATLSTGADALARLTRAEAAVMVSEINTLRQWITSFKAAVAAASSLANLQTRVAALASMPDRTLSQAKQAILNSLGDGTAD